MYATNPISCNPLRGVPVDYSSRMPFLRRFAFSAALIISGIVVAPGAASADVERIRDESRDVVRTWWTGCERAADQCVEHHRTAPKRGIADIVWSRHDYTERRLRLRMKLRDTVMRPQIGTYLGWELRGSHGTGLLTQILSAGGHNSTVFLSYTVDGYECDEARTTSRRETGVYTLVIPRTCLPQSSWVRVAAGVMVENRSTGRMWHDDPRVGDDLKVRNSVADHHFGPRLYPD